MGLHTRLQATIEKVFFNGKSTRQSVYLTFVVGNIFLILILFYLVLNTAAYDWTGQLYPAGSGFNLQTPFDTAIPFVPEAVIFYVYLFYPFVILTVLFFVFVQYRDGYALGWSLVTINAVAVIIYVVFPVSTYWYRQELLANPIAGNLWATQVYKVFDSDTSFNCFPSLHAAVSAICFFAWFQYSKSKPNFLTKTTATVAFAIAAGVILSTLLIKQHYIADEIAGVELAWIVGVLVFKKLYKNSRGKISDTV